MPTRADEAKADLRNVSISGGLEGGKARLVVEAMLSALTGQKEPLIYATSLQHLIQVSPEKLEHSITAEFEVLQGDPQELSLSVAGPAEIRNVTSEALQDWSVRTETNGTRSLILRPKKSEPRLNRLTAVISADQVLTNLPATVQAFTLAPSQPALGNGFVKVQPSPEVSVSFDHLSGLVPVEAKFLPETLRGGAGLEPEALSFQFHGSAYALPLQITAADPESRQVVLRGCKLVGQLHGETAAFTLSATAVVRQAKGGSLGLLSGGVALTQLEDHPDWRVKWDQNQFVLAFDRAGEFPIRLKFDAKVQRHDRWKSVDFRVAPGAMQSLTLQGLATESQVQLVNGARPEQAGPDFVTYLPPTGAVQLSWSQARPEAEGKLFYSVETLCQISVSPGLMRESALLQFKVMQGEVTRVGLLLRGAGEVTRVQGDQVLAWQVEPVPNSTDRRLTVQLNQPEKEHFDLQVQLQAALGAFPQSVDAIQLHAEGATRSTGYYRVVNEGAVRLEIAQANGVAQISPEQFPQTDAAKALFRAGGSQQFVYRFSGMSYALRIQADQILPELTVSQVLAYHLAENELSLDAELEVEVREAPVRELLISVPRGYALARLTAAGLSDYFLREPPESANAELRLVYGQPVSGRQLIQLRLERNQGLAEGAWSLPHVALDRARSVRGYIGVSADAGFRLTPEGVSGLTEIATAFFPRKIAAIQSAFRLNDPAWQASMRVERLAQTVQADVLHLFSIGEGIAYGSSVINYVVSGSPVAVFRVQLSEEYFNVEFTGKDLRNWQKTTNGYVIQLHTPVSGAYTLLASYERPFKAQGEALAFTGARPLEAASEQGYTLVVSAYQFQVRPVDVSPGLLPLETAEVPAEYRLFFDAPILAAYRYTARPFNLRLALSPLIQGSSLSQVVDRAALVTHVSKAGQVLTEARYLVKNRGNQHFRVALPEGNQLWSALVNGATVVPVTDGKDNLIPLPQRADPNAVSTVELKVAARSKTAGRVRAAAPVVGAPVMLAEWKLEPDTNQRLIYRKGSLAPALGIPDASGFGGLARLLSGEEAGRAWFSLLAALGLIAMAVVVWRGTVRAGVVRFSLRHVVGTVLGSVAVLLALAAFLNLGQLSQRYGTDLPREVSFLAPIQQAGSALEVEVANVEERASFWRVLAYTWPALLALGAWLYAASAGESPIRSLGVVLGWLFLAWAALRWPNGAGAFLGVVAAFLLLHSVIPAFRRLWRLPKQALTTPPGSPSGGPATAVALALLAAGLCWTLGGVAAAEPVAAAQAASAAGEQLPTPATPDGTAGAWTNRALADSVTQQVLVKDQYAIAKTAIRWQATKDQVLPLLFRPAVLTGIQFPTNALKLLQASPGLSAASELRAEQSGQFDIELQYQVPVTKRDPSGVILPVHYGLVNTVTLTLANLDVDVSSDGAVSVTTQHAGSNTVARLVLAPTDRPWISWKPRSRDLKSEKAVFYAELHQVYVPLAGVIEGLHFVSVRPAQGELTELILSVPNGMTVTDVLDPAQGAPPAEKDLQRPAVTPLVSVWRFDPDTHQLRVNLTPAQSRPFTVLVRSQASPGPLPYEQKVGLLSLQNAAAEVGLLGFGTGNEVQLDSVNADALAPINVEDFPAAALRPLQAQVPGLTLRRAYRYAEAKAQASLKASAVEPDVRVETQETLSLGEDRSVLAVKAVANISRAGIFRLSFILPPALDIESVSGDALSHWTEAKVPDGRAITLHLRTKTEGQQQFAISLVGPGIKPGKGWAVPQFVLREASKQQGTLLLVPEQGLRLQVSSRNGVTQLDPQKSGVHQKGVLAFRLLQAPWSLTLDIEQVEPWIQVTSLQHATVTESALKILANLQYQIENTGLKALRVALPTNANTVQFQGDQVSDYRPLPGAITNNLQQWEIKLHRRILGPYFLQARYQTPLPERSTEATLLGIQVSDVNLQRGFVTVESGGRLQVRIDAPPSAVQAAEWQSIPRPLQQDLQNASAQFAYRLVEPAFTLALKLDRHEAARLLPARVNEITLTSVVSDDGVMLTQVHLELVPGDKRLLYVSLPKDARFWFAFVNHDGVWPWREQDRILLPLEPRSLTAKAVPVEFFYSSQVGTAGGRQLDLELLAPQFDLPLENISWRVYLNEKWKLKHWKGSLQLQDEQVTRATALDFQSYLQTEASVQRKKTQEAEQMIALGNSALAQGDPQQARRAFQAAFGLSQGDDAFNEDARVQLNNLKLQQALVGLNVRQAANAGASAAASASAADSLTAKLRDLRSRKEANYTQQDAKAIIDRNSSEDNSAFMRLAQRLLQQQEAAVTTPAAIRANIPEQGRLLTFKRAVVVDPWADLRIGLAATAAKVASWSVRLWILLGALLVFAGFAWAARAVQDR